MSGKSKDSPGTKESAVHDLASSDDISATMRPGLARAATGSPQSLGEALGASEEISATIRPGMRHRSGLPASSDEASATARDRSLRWARTEPGPDDVRLRISPGGVRDISEQVTPECPGRYLVQTEKGRGGNGRVLVVADAHLGRDIALKEMFRGADPIEQQSLETSFLREARLAGQLEHPNIVPVYELGRTESGSLYYTMRLVRGRTLSAELEGCGSLQERLKCLKNFLDLCNAIAFAHSRGVVHRDLKPQNVMVGEFGETVLLDWGLAKVKGQADEPAARSIETLRLPADSSATIAGMALGTPAYMSPEQARGEVGHVDELSDVWGLGAVLYEILTGAPPFMATTATDTMNNVLQAPLVRVRERCPEAPPELAAVAEKALSKDREGRYPSARDLSADVEAYMTGGRVSVYRYSSWELLRRFARENRPAIVSAVVVLLAIVGALVAVTFALRDEQAARRQEVEARAREQHERLRAELQLARTYAERAEQLLQRYRFTSAYASAARSLQHNPAHPRSPSHSPGFAESVPGSYELRLRAASAVLQAGYRFMTKPVVEAPLGEVLGLVAFSPDSRLLAAAVYDGTVRIFEVATGRELLSLPADSKWAFAVAFSPDGSLLASAGREGTIALWSMPDGRRVATLEGHQEQVRGLAFSPDGRLIA